MDKNCRTHVIPLKLRIDMNEDHEALDLIIRDYSKRMGMSMSTFVTEVLLDVLLKERKVGVFRNVDISIMQQTKSNELDNNKLSDEEETISKVDEISDSKNQHEQYNDPEFLESIIDLNDEFM